jgi:predicted nucleic acid-binding protein
LEPRGLIDTGALLALLDRDDKWHTACLAGFERARLPVATSAAVLAELFHLIGDGKRNVSAAWRLIRSGAITVVPIADDDLSELQMLMERYSDRPMDFADATLVHLARKLRVTDILTVDHNDFETYRIEGKRGFRILPPRLGRRGKRS